MDSFKGSLSAIEATEAATKAISDVLPACEVEKIPLSDGGEGLAAILVHQLGGHIHRIDAVDTLMRPVSVKLGAVEGCAIIEMAEAAGLTLLAEHERNPLNTTTYGVGMMIRAALDLGYRKLLVGLGGSATNDAGLGALQAIGLRCFDSHGMPITTPVTGAKLADIAHIDISRMRNRLRGVALLVVCDVTNPFCGHNGAAYVFAPQKGASPDGVLLLDAGLRKVAHVIKHDTGISVEHLNGAGAAGGMGGTLTALAGAAMVHGIDEVLDLVHFDSRICNAGLIITGEGRLDAQSAMGKVISGVVSHSKLQNIPVLAFVGRVDNPHSIRKIGLLDAVEITPHDTAPKDYMQPSVAADNLCCAVKNWLNAHVKHSID